MRSLSRLVLAIFLWGPLSRDAQAQADSTAFPQDLKIGLVLSGGGAKALAQIGALKVIEQSGVQLDYIGGTSMGAIIGAMYSLGYTASEIETYLKAVDWEALLNNTVPRNRLSYFDRKLDARYLLTFPVQNGQIQLPRGINFAQYIIKELSFITQQAYHYPSMAAYPIPFLCVATNLQSGKARIFADTVRIVDALRASSALPSLFTPHQIGDSLYIDGGVVNNYPAEAVRNRGMDYLIGIDVQRVRRTPEELNSVVRVLEQTSTFINQSELERQLAETDLLIQPEIDIAGVTTFDLLDTIIAAGEHAARKQWAQLLALARRDAGRPGPVAEERAMPLHNFWVNGIVIHGNEANTRRFILGKLRIRENALCSIDKLEKGLDQLYGSRFFETVDYTLEPLDSSGYNLHINLRESEVLSAFNLGLNYNDDFNAALLFNFTQRNLLFKNARFNVDLALSDNPRAYLNYYIDRGFIPSLGFKFRSHRFDFQSFRSLNAYNQGIYQDFSLDLFLQSTIRDAYAWGGGLQLENVDINQDFESSDDQIELNRSYINYYGFLDFDSFDREFFPRQGMQLRAQYRIISRRLGLEEFREPSSVIDFRYNQVFNLGSSIRVISRLYGASTLGPDLDFPYKIHLGSMGQRYPNYIEPFVGYRFMELNGRNALVLRGDLLWAFWKKNFLVLRYNLGKLEPTLDDLFASDIILDGYSLGYVFDSPVGPLEFNIAGSSNHDNVYTYVSLGFWF